MKLLLLLFFLLPFVFFSQSKEITKKFNNAEVLFNKKKYKKAIKAYSKVIKIDPKNGVAYYKRSIAKNKIGHDFCEDLKSACKYGADRLGACENHELYCQ